MTPVGIRDNGKVDTAAKSAPDANPEELRIPHTDFKPKINKYLIKNGNKINCKQYNPPWFYVNHDSEKHAKSSCTDYILDIEKSHTPTFSLKITSHYTQLARILTL